MTQKIQDKIDRLQARLDDPATVDVEKETCIKQIELLKNIAYSDEAREFFVERDLVSPDEALGKFVKQCYPSLIISDGQNHFEIKEVILRSRENGDNFKNPFLFLFGVNGYGPKIIILGDGYTNANPIKQHMEINLWGWYNKIGCDDSSWNANNNDNKDFEPRFLTKHARELLEAYTRFMAPLTLEKEDPKKLTHEF